MTKYEKDHSRNANDLPLVTIPVHVIVVHRPGHAVGVQTNISNARIQSQINALNLDFLRKNTDANNTPPIFKVSDSRIQFCLASVAPNGQSTNGISRYATNQNFDNNEISIKRSTRWDPKKYLNIWVAPDIEGLGYAYLPTPSSLPSADEDGVVILTEAFGGPNSGANAPFNLGRTVTHEVGHYLGLDHIWGEGCGVDDGISDTPNQAEENYDCPRHPSPSCSNQGDMFMNYMDYTDDYCMNAFSTGQVNYMRSILNTSRAQLILPGRTNCATEDSGDGSTCNDGIKNGDETGIDCGGSCKPCNQSEILDAGLVNLSFTTSSASCAQDVNFKVTMKNFGSTNLTSALVEIRSQNSVLTKLNWNGNLAANAQININLPSITLNSGNYSVQAMVKNPNGKSDSNPGNNQKNLSMNLESNNQLVLVIKPDEFGADISWRIKDSKGQVIANGGNYPDFNTNTISEPICIPSGCYKLIMSDSYGDGICCDYGKGWYELRSSDGSVLLDSDGYYGYSETSSFCLDGNEILSRIAVDRQAKEIKAPRKLIRPHRISE